MKVYGVRERRKFLKMWAESDLSITEFCNEYNLKETTFHYWKKVDGIPDPENDEKTFVQVPVNMAFSPESNHFILEHGKVKLYIPSGFSEGDLERILLVLEARYGV